MKKNFCYSISYYGYSIKKVWLYKKLLSNITKWNLRVIDACSLEHTLRSFVIQYQLVTVNCNEMPFYNSCWNKLLYSLAQCKENNFSNE